MKLKEYMELVEPGIEITCWDKDVDSEFYFYAKERDDKPLYGDDFPNVDKCMDRLAEVLDVVKIHDNGVEVNLYEKLEHPEVIRYAKEKFYEEHQYEDDSDVTMLLFDDNVTNISQGYDRFSRMMVECLDSVYGAELSNDVARSQMKYGDMLSFLNSNGILLMQPIIADCVDTLLPIGWNGSEEDYEKICEQCFDAYFDCGDEEIDVWDVVKDVIETVKHEAKPSLADKIQAAELKSSAQTPETHSPDKEQSR